MNVFQKRLFVTLGCASAAMLVLSSCTSGGSPGGGDGRDTFVFAASADPASLDPAFASDGESFRIAQQIFEGLVGVEEGTPDPEPLLAESWDVSDDGTQYTFHLQQDVRFHDGTEFDADAVCFNFDRWNNFTGILQSMSLSYEWIIMNGGFAESEDPSLDGTGVYDHCVAEDPSTAVVTLRRPMPEFISALTSPAFAMQSPTALEEYDADGVSGDAGAPVMPAYATEHPTGTGPFVFESWTRGENVRLTANEDYWGELGDVRNVVIPVIADPTARSQALQAGDIDGYDLVSPSDEQALRDAGFQVITRDPFNILYLGFNQSVPALQDLRVRQAIAHAINKESLVSSALSEGSEVAINFIPPTAHGWTEDVETYDYDPDRARELLAEANQENLELEFNYPTNVSRPYMPTPEQTYQALSADLKDVGITVVPKPEPWTQYTNTINGTSNHGIRILGWTGEYNAAYNFFGAFFSGPTTAWGFDDPELFEALDAARFTPTEDEQDAAFAEANRTISEFVPGVPLAHPVSFLAFAPDVEHYPASPVQNEVFNRVVFAE